MEYAFTLTNRTSALIHSDNVMASDDLAAWRKDPKNKHLSVKGDDRSPPWTWHTYLYSDGTNLVCPQENIMTCLRKAATQIQMPKGKKSFKELSQSALLMAAENCEFFNGGKPVPVAPIVAMANESFHDQFEAVKKLGFELKVKRATVKTSKHVRVRAMFVKWSVKGIIEVLEPEIITTDILRQMFEIGGKYVGLFDWRPGSKESPGPYGTFTANLSVIGGS